MTTPVYTRAKDLIEGDFIVRFKHSLQILSIRTYKHPQSETDVIEVTHEKGTVSYMPNQQVEMGSPSPPL